ncbi:MAG: hypothetical protein AB7Y46_02750, partial [Armatimonadota bacterium]
MQRGKTCAALIGLICSLLPLTGLSSGCTGSGADQTGAVSYDITRPPATGGDGGMLATSPGDAQELPDSPLSSPQAPPG